MNLTKLVWHEIRERPWAMGASVAAILLGVAALVSVRHITDAAMHSGTTRVADVLVRPIAGDDVAAALVRTALGPPTGRMREIAGPEIF